MNHKLSIAFMAKVAKRNSIRINPYCIPHSVCTEVGSSDWFGLDTDFGMIRNISDWFGI